MRVGTILLTSEWVRWSKSSSKSTLLSTRFAFVAFGEVLSSYLFLMFYRSSLARYGDLSFTESKFDSKSTGHASV